MRAPPGARGEILRQRLYHLVRPGARREGAVEAHIEEAPLHVFPALLADDQIAAQVDQDVADPGLDEKIPEAVAVELVLAVARRDHEAVGIRLDRQIGRAPCRERVGQYVTMSVGAGYFKNKRTEKNDN